MYVTECPECDGDLFLVAFKASCRIPVMERDGLDLTLGPVDTEDEIVKCSECDWTGPLETAED
jgi:hypothetical protein